MSLFSYLQLQPIDPQDDGTLSDFNQYAQDEMFDLTQDTDGDDLLHAWGEIEQSLRASRKRDKNKS